MSDFEIDFECGRAEYEFQAASPGEKRELSGSGFLVRKGKLKPVRPKSKDIEKAIELLVRCDSAQLPLVAVGIARSMGGLLPATTEEPLFVWEGMQSRLREMFAGKLKHHPTIGSPLAPADGSQRAGDVGVYLVLGKDGKPKLALRPDNLMQALTLYAARQIATGTTFGACLHCKGPFLRGGGSKKRGDARFCSDPCKWEFHNERRRKAKLGS
jgi:hypothetical protein